MKKWIFIMAAMTLMMIPVIAYGQNQITRPSKKTEQASGNKPNKQSSAKRNNGSSGSGNNNKTKRSPKPLNELDPVLQNLINNMVYVEGGSFMMGSDDSDAYNDEKPVHRETVGSFSIGKYEVTQKEWKAVMGNIPSHFKGDDLPVENVSWNDCQKFIRKLNSLTGRNFRLPTEAEWEYAARGGNRSNGYKYSGSNDINNVAWYDGNSGNRTHNVGTKAANELGLYDMSGNVFEWTSSKLCRDYSQPRNLPFLVIRGGSWQDRARECRLSVRVSVEATIRFNTLSLRLVL